MKLLYIFDLNIVPSPLLLIGSTKLLITTLIDIIIAEIFSYKWFPTIN